MARRDTQSEFPPASRLVTAPRPHRRFTAALLLVAGALALVALVTPGKASAASCAKQVVADWYGDGRVDQIYELHCYADAIRSLPVDVLDYSNAKEDILRALSYAKRGKSDPGDAGTGSGTGTGGGTGTGSGSGNGSGGDGGDDTTARPGGGRTTEGPYDGTTGEETVAGGSDVDTSGPSSVPVPLLVLGGLALLLLAAGGAGYVSRRSQARRGSGRPDDPAV